jgi:hypothetical protein
MPETQLVGNAHQLGLSLITYYLINDEGVVVVR